MDVLRTAKAWWQFDFAIYRDSARRLGGTRLGEPCASLCHMNMSRGEERAHTVKRRARPITGVLED
jgi:hypothetical protein